VDVVLLGRLLGENERLGEAAHGFPVVGEFAGDLHHDPVSKGGLRVNLSDLGVTVIELELLDAVVDLPLSNHRFRLPVWCVQAPMYERRILIVEPSQNQTKYKYSLMLLVI